MNMVNILVNARSLVEKGWCKGKGADEDGNVCPIVALNIVVGEDEKLFSISYAFLQRFLPFTTRSIMAFNDYEETTKEDILDFFDRAIFAAKEDEVNFSL